VLQQEARFWPRLPEYFGGVAEAMSQSDRPAIRKFVAALRAAEAYNNGSVSGLTEVNKWRGRAKENLILVVKDKKTPVGEVYDMWSALLDAAGKSKQVYDDAFLSIEPIAFANWPANPELLLLKGKFYTDYAWEARGNGAARSVTPQGWEVFGERLNTAEEALTQAWKLNPKDERIARRMITVEMGKGRSRDNMEQWFQRAMALNPNYYDACHAKLYYLQPQWHGSWDAMREFAAECLGSTKWGGRVPLIVVDFHEMLANAYKDSANRDAYYQQPPVWSDIKSAFDKFLKMNPKEPGYHHNYALHAFWAHEWADLNRELSLLGPINYEYFGGRSQFDSIVKAAKENSQPGK
jgi:hypothetical protein